MFATHAPTRCFPSIFVIVGGVVFFAATLILHGGHVLNSDEGIVLNAAWQLWHGKEMYVDFFEYIPPGAAYLTYWTWHLIDSPSYAAAKLLAIALFFISTALIYLITRRLGGSRGASGAAAMLWLIASLFYPIINHNVYCSYAIIAMTLTLMLAAERRRSILYMMAGSAGGIAFLFLQTKGLAALAAVILWIITSDETLTERGRYLLCFLLGVILPLLTLLHWSASTLLYSLVFYPTTYYWRYGASALTAPVTIAAVLIAMVALILAWRTIKPSLKLLALVQAALILSSVTLLDWGHLIINSFPLLIGAALGWQWIVSRLPATFTFWGYLIGITALGILSGLVIDKPLASLASRNIYLPPVWAAPLDRLRLSPEFSAARYVYAGPFLPGLPFELKKPNPFFYSHLLVCGNDCELATILTLKRLRPEYAAIAYPMVDRLGYERTPVDHYISRTYTPCLEVSTNSLAILAREPTLCPHDTASSKF